MENHKVQLDSREHDKAIAALREARQDVARIWQDFRRSLQEQAKSDFGTQKPRL